MTERTFLLILAVVVILLVPLVPKMIRLRIRALRWLRWNRLADWHERNLGVLAPIVRSLMVGIAVVLLVLGLR